MMLLLFHAIWDLIVKAPSSNILLYSMHGFLSLLSEALDVLGI
jgi:hypothetical protein